MFGRIHIGGEHSDQEEYERDPGNESGRFPQQAQSTGNLAQPRQRDEGPRGGHPRVAKDRWDHGGHRASGSGNKVGDADADEGER